MLKKALLYLAIFVGSLLLLYNLDNGIDYFDIFRRVTKVWLEGRSNLYDSLTRDYYNPPWLVWLLAPTLAFDGQTGLALLRAVTVVIIIYGLASLTPVRAGWGRLWAIVLGLLNLHQFDLIYRGEIDGLVLLGLVLAIRFRNWYMLGIAYTLMAMKPPNTIPLLLFFLIIEWRDKKLLEAAKGLIIPVAVFLASLLLHGWWPPRLLESYSAKAPQEAWKTTIWRAAEMLNIPVIIPVALTLVVLAGAVWLWKYTGNREDQIALILTTTFLVTPYALSYHYVLLLVVVFPWLVCWKLWVGVLIYLLTYLPLVRVFIGRERAYIDVIFVAALFVAVVVWIKTGGSRLVVAQKPPENEADRYQVAGVGYQA